MLVRQKLTKNQVITVNALIVIDVHAKDVVAKLAELGVSHFLKLILPVD